MSDFFVLKREVCPECQGRKWLSHPAWLEFGEWYESQEPAPNEAQGKIWWQEHGWWGELPPEEYQCSTCEGKGMVEQEVDLMQALDKLGVSKAMRIAYSASARESME